MMKFKLITHSFFIAASLFFISSASAQLIITEVLPNPQTGGDEFVEIHNSGSETINLEGWQLDDILTGGRKPKSLSGTINPNQYLAIYFSISTFNNDKDEVNLLDTSGQVINNTSYQNPARGFSYSLINSEWGWTENPTPNQANQITQTNIDQEVQPEESSNNTQESQPTIQTTTTEEPDQFNGIYLNEALPNPIGSDSTLEFIELYNSNGYSVELGDWQLDDSAGGSRPYTVPKQTIILPLNYLVFYAEDTKIALNNNGDEIRLFLPSNQLADSIIYKDKALEGIAFAKTQIGIWSWSKTPTPGQQNTFNEPQQENQSTPDPEEPVLTTIQNPAAILLSQSQNLPPNQPEKTGKTNSESLSMAPSLNKPIEYRNKPFPAKNSKPLIGFNSALIISLALGLLAVIIKKAFLAKK